MRNLNERIKNDKFHISQITLQYDLIILLIFNKIYFKNLLNINVTYFNRINSNDITVK